MWTAFMIYVRAVGIYALVTIPAIGFPMMYILSMFYVIFYGWFAWGLFSMIYLLTDKARMNFPSKIFILTFGIVLSVAFAFQMIGVIGNEGNVWTSGFLIFPAAAVIAGWISLYTGRKAVKADCPGYREDNSEYELLENIDYHGKE